MILRQPWRRVRRRPWGSLLFLLLTLLGSALVIKPAAAIEREQVIQALRATVQVIVPDNDFEVFSLGSGTVMSEDGLILTNHHVVAGDRTNGLFNDDGLVGIAVPPADLRGEAILKYVGVVVKVDEKLDLALVQITGMVDDPQAPLPPNLGLTPIELGNSDDLMISDEINMFGYPGLGGNTPTYTKGIVSGFLDEDRDGIYEWIKTDAELSHGNSGGLATDDRGRFVGVPTAGNTDDVGKIGLVRTGNLAIDFVQSYFPNQPGDGSAAISNVRFAQAVNRSGQPVGVDVQFPSGITDLYAVFDYSGFEDGKTLTYVWYVDGFEGLRDSFAWEEGESGSSWVSVYNDEGLPDGFIELELIYDGVSLYRGGVIIGEGTVPQPPANSGGGGFGPIRFAEGVENDRPVNPGAVFSNLKKVYAFFDYEGMANGTSWMTRWYFNGQQVLENQAVWDAGESGSYYISLSHPDGLPVGEYTLELYIAGELNQSGNFTVQGGTAPGPRELTVTGVVLDRDNQRLPVAGALIVFLKPGILIDDWVEADFPDDMVHGSGTSNAEGRFQLDAKVTPGESYGIVVVHQQYQPIAQDAYQIPSDASDPYELTITMRRK